MKKLSIIKSFLDSLLRFWGSFSPLESIVKNINFFKENSAWKGWKRHLAGRIFQRSDSNCHLLLFLLPFKVTIKWQRIWDSHHLSRQSCHCSFLLLKHQNASHFANAATIKSRTKNAFFIQKWRGCKWTVLLRFAKFHVSEKKNLHLREKTKNRRILILALEILSLRNKVIFLNKLRWTLIQPKYRFLIHAFPKRLTREIVYYSDYYHCRGVKAVPSDCSVNLGTLPSSFYVLTQCLILLHAVISITITMLQVKNLRHLEVNLSKAIQLVKCGAGIKKQAHWLNTWIVIVLYDHIIDTVQ